MAEYQLEYCQFPHCRESANGPVKAEPGPDHAALCPSRQAASIPLPSVTAQAGRLRDSLEAVRRSVDAVRDEALRELLSYCRAEADNKENVDGERSAYEDVADKLAGILDGES